MSHIESNETTFHRVMHDLELSLQTFKKIAEVARTAADEIDAELRFDEESSMPYIFISDEVTMELKVTKGDDPKIDIGIFANGNLVLEGTHGDSDWSAVIALAKQFKDDPNLQADYPAGRPIMADAMRELLQSLGYTPGSNQQH